MTRRQQRIRIQYTHDTGDDGDDKESNDDGDDNDELSGSDDDRDPRGTRADRGSHGTAAPPAAVLALFDVLPGRREGRTSAWGTRPAGAAGHQR